MIMNELASAFKHFITRDILYIIGGVGVIISFFYLFDRLPSSDLDTAHYLYITAVGYVVGYAIQDGLSLTPLVTTSLTYNPNRFLYFFYAKFMRLEREKDYARKLNQSYLDRAYLNKAYSEVIELSKERSFNQLQRTIHIKQIGTTIGSNALISSLLIGIKWWKRGLEFDLFLFIGLFVLAAVLILLGWIKSIYQTWHVVNLHSDIRSTKKLIL